MDDRLTFTAWIGAVRLLIIAESEEAARIALYEQYGNTWHTLRQHTAEDTGELSEYTIKTTTPSEYRIEVPCS